MRTRTAALPVLAATDPDDAPAGVAGVELPASLRSSPGDLLLENRSDILRRIHAQQLLEALATDRLLPPRLTAAAAPKNRALPESGSRASACSMMRPARPLSCDSSLMVKRFGLTEQRVGVLAAGQPVRALEGTHRQRILLQHEVGASQHHPTAEILGITLELAREARNHGLRGIRRRLGAPRPVGEAGI